MILDDWMKEKILTNDNKQYNRQTLENYQLEKLNDLIKYAKENSSFYRELYKDIQKIKSFKDIENIPVIDKKDIVEHGNKMICVSQSDISRIVSLDTSGTMGKSKRIFFTKEDQDLTVDFFEKGLSLLVDRNDTMLIMLPYRTQNSVGDLIRQSLENIGVKPVLNGTLNSFEETINLIISNNINSIVGMPIEVLALGRYLKNNNLDNNIKSILLSADMVSDIIIEEIKKAYGCEVFNHFGMTETGLGGAVDCSSHKGMHIRENDLLIEIVNPLTKERVKEGEEGEMLITTLTRRAMPLIRYATGDISSFVRGECGCKSILKRLSNIKCRLDNRVHIGNNIFISINELDQKLFRIPILTNYKVSVKEIEDRHDMYINIVSISKEKNEDLLKKELRDLILSIPKISKAYEMGYLDIVIDITYSEEYIHFYQGKRKIIYE